MAEKMLEVRDLKVYFEVKKSLASSLFGKPQVLKAVDGVSFDINRGEILSLVGESGSGKTTTGKAILQLVPVTEGSIRFHGEEIVGRKDLSEFRKNAQMIYQDPYQSLNPRQYEPVSMLDASIRTGIIRLMLKERDEKGVAYLFITHDLSLAWLISDKIAIMYLGKIMEIGTADEIVNNPKHPYSKALLGIMPVPGKVLTGKRKILEGETPNAGVEIKGCKFCGRCPEVMPKCHEIEPENIEISPGHFVMCHKYSDKQE